MTYGQSASTRSMSLHSFQEPCRTVSEYQLMRVWNSSSRHRDRMIYQEPLGSAASASGEA